jgi:hypothetical protein
MDARVDPLDERTHHDVVDLLRQADFTEAIVLFGRLVKLAYSQGQIDAFASVVRRIPVDYEGRSDQ